MKKFKGNKFDFDSSEDLEYQKKQIKKKVKLERKHKKFVEKNS
jgi:hypothetical protein